MRVYVRFIVVGVVGAVAVRGGACCVGISPPADIVVKMPWV
jgi:hypothetical protein